MRTRLRIKSNKSLHDNANALLSSMYEELISHSERVLDHPRLKAELHRMRIVGKPLRYAMEIFETAFGEPYASCFEGIKHLIELMGRVHDHDVTILILRNYLQEIQFYNKSCENKNERVSPRGIRELIQQRMNRRAVEFNEVCTILKTWQEENFRNTLLISMK